MAEIKKKENKKTEGKEKVQKSNKFDKVTLAKVLYNMYLARQVDNKALSLLKQGKTFFHIPGSGHEAIQVAVAMQMDATKDWLFPYYRDLALVFTSGVKAYDFFLQCFGKADDPSSGGRQMPGHYGSKHLNIPGQSSPTGTQFLQAVGTALASVKKGENSVSYVSSGEGTTSQGEFHEAVNWAAREKLPVIFVIQNNGYAISVPVSKQSGGLDNSISEMMTGYHNLLRIRVDGTDFFESFEAAERAVEYARERKGPVLIEADVVRLLSHSSSDDQKKYRNAEEIEEDLKNDPINKFIEYTTKKGIFTIEEIEAIKDSVNKDINAAVDEAAKAEDPKVEDSTKYVFDESGFKELLEYENDQPFGQSIVMVDSINHALHEEMQKNDKVIYSVRILQIKKGAYLLLLRD